jgi:hypothetical protein
VAVHCDESLHDMSVLVGPHVCVLVTHVDAPMPAIPAQHESPKVQRVEPHATVSTTEEASELAADESLEPPESGLVCPPVESAPESEVLVPAGEASAAAGVPSCRSLHPEKSVHPAEPANVSSARRRGGRARTVVTPKDLTDPPVVNSPAGATRAT